MDELSLPYLWCIYCKMFITERLAERFITQYRLFGICEMMWRCGETWANFSSSIAHGLHQEKCSKWQTKCPHIGLAAKPRVVQNLRGRPLHRKLCTCRTGVLIIQYISTQGTKHINNRQKAHAYTVLYMQNWVCVRQCLVCVCVCVGHLAIPKSDTLTDKSLSTKQFLAACNQNKGKQWTKTDGRSKHLEMTTFWRW